MKLMILGRRAPGITRAACHAHLRDVHGHMVVHPPADAGAMPDGYVQNHVVDAAMPAVSGRHAICRDLVTELWFADIDALRASTATPYYLQNLKPDEPRFVDDTTVEKMPVRPRDLLEGSQHGPWKAFIAVSFAGEAQPDIATALKAAPGLDALVENSVMPGPDGSAPFVSVIYEGWFAARSDAESLVGRLQDLLHEAGQTVDTARCFALLAEQYDTSRLRSIG